MKYCAFFISCSFARSLRSNVRCFIIIIGCIHVKWNRAYRPLISFHTSFFNMQTIIFFLLFLFLHASNVGLRCRLPLFVWCFSICTCSVVVMRPDPETITAQGLHRHIHHHHVTHTKFI